MKAPSTSLVWLIFASIALNYIDRGAVSVAGPLIQKDLGLTATGYGIIVSAFYWTYVPAQTAAGWLADRVSVHRLMAAGVAIWAIATMLTGLAGGVVSLIMLRLAMGIGEGVAFPCGSKIIARVPTERRSTANVALSGGIALGPFIGTVAGGLLLTQLGWRPMFVIFGAITLLWLIPWAGRRAEVDGPADSGRVAVTPWPVLLRMPAVWAMVVLHFCGSYGFYFLIAWLPLWLVNDRGFDIANMAAITGLVYLVQAGSGFAAARLSDRVIRSGADASTIRRRLLFACAAVGITGLLTLTGTASTPALIFWLVVASLGIGPIPNLLVTFGQTLAGQASAGRWIGIQSGLGNVSGIVGPIVTGMIVDAQGYGATFILTSVVVGFGVAVFAVAIPKLRPLLA